MFYFLKKLFSKVTSIEKNRKPYVYSLVLHLLEDDYLMLELLPPENIDFIKQECIRLRGLSTEHKTDFGYTDISVIGEKPVKTLSKQIPIGDIERLMEDNGLYDIEEFVMQFEGYRKTDDTIKGFGTHKVAIMCDVENGYLKNIWINTTIHTEEHREVIAAGLSALGKKYGFVLVNWFIGRYYNLADEQQLGQFSSGVDYQ